MLFLPLDTEELKCLVRVFLAKSFDKIFKTQNMLFGPLCLKNLLKVET